MRKALAMISHVEGWVLGGAILAIAAINLANVFCRNVLGTSILWGEEVVRFLIVVVCFVGLSHAAHLERHIRMTALQDLLPSRITRPLIRGTNLVTGLLCGALAWFSWSYAASVDNVSPVLGISLTTVYMVAPFGFVLAAIHYFLHAFGVEVPGGASDPAREAAAEALPEPREG